MLAHPRVSFHSGWPDLSPDGKHIPPAFDRSVGMRSPTRTGLAAAAGGGVAAYLFGYVITYVLGLSAVRDSGYWQILEAVGRDGQGWKLLGWVFYDAHFARTTVRLETGIPLLGGAEVVSLITELGLSPLLYVVPPALLVAAGIVAARAAGAGTAGEALRIGPAVVLGYVPLAVAGAFLFRITEGGSFGGPTLVPAIGLAGVVYPLVFGTLGAVLGAQLVARERRRGTPA